MSSKNKRPIADVSSSSDEEKPNKKSKKEVKRKDVEMWISKMSVELTGARSGDTLQGCSVCSKGVLMRLRAEEGFVFPPRKMRLEGIQTFPDLWRNFMIKLCSISFFADKSSDDEREKWLMAHASLSWMSVI
jgi:hypothetical protein